MMIDKDISLEVIQMVDAAMAWSYMVVPKSKDNGSIEMYISDKKDMSQTMAELSVLLGKNVDLIAVDDVSINKLLLKYYPGGAVKGNKKQINLSEDFLSGIISEASNLHSSDIHIETYEDRCRVRFRVDGKLVERYKIEKHDYPALVNKIKIRANLDIAEKRLPQDGRINFNNDVDKFDIRVSVLPTLEGEKIVLRLLSKDAGDIGLERLGMSKEQEAVYHKAITKPNGIILISGPTGSGKTTTLYATLKELNREDSNILTIEDPVEYTLEGINQVQVKEEIGMTYAQALRTFLRQDPDIIMLGEIRDNETAQMAVRAALTGHLVFSTIHTNSAWGTVSRLLDMDIPPYLLANTLNLSVAQRLVRLLCPKCKQKIKVGEGDKSLEKYLPDDIEQYSVAHGCPDCFYTGYKGRKAVYEMINVDKDIESCIKASGEDSDEVLSQKNIHFLKDSVLELLKSGETSPEEVISYLI
jgi:general secretion pathway protein E/type IV pilus assembly protein PilB